MKTGYCWRCNASSVMDEAQLKKGMSCMKRLVVLMVLMLVGLWIYGKFGMPDTGEALSEADRRTESSWDTAGKKTIVKENVVGSR